MSVAAAAKSLNFATTRVSNAADLGDSLERFQENQGFHLSSRPHDLEVIARVIEIHILMKTLKKHFHKIHNQLKKRTSVVLCCCSNNSIMQPAVGTDVPSDLTNISFMSSLPNISSSSTVKADFP